MNTSAFNKFSIAIFLLLALIPFQNMVYDLFMMKVFCFAIFAAALNLLLGYAGLLSFGHAAFFGSASYVTAHVMKEWGVTPEIGLFIGVICSTALGYVFGSLAIRRQGIYFAMITLALAQIIYFIATQAPFTNGEDGIQGVPRGSFLGLIDLSSSSNMYWFSLGVFAFAFFLVMRIVRSPFGQVLKSIRENEPRAISLGYNVDRYKLMAFTISAGLAGLGGGLKSLVLQLASLTDVAWQMSGEAVLMTILGGIGTLWGPVVGAAVIINLQNYLSNLGGWSTIATGAIFVICVLAFRRGIVGEIAQLLKATSPDQNMPPVEAVLSCLRQYANFKGRASREEFWWFTLFTFFASITISTLAIALLGPQIGAGLGIVFYLLVLLPSIAVGARRFHDMGFSGWWQLLSLTGVGTLIVLIWLMFPGTSEENRFGNRVSLGSK